MENTKQYINQIEEAANYIQKQLPFMPDIAIILGSGLGPLANETSYAISIDYTDIPYFPRSTVPGHEGKLIAGTISGKPVLIMKGRFHYYEGYGMDKVTFPIRVFAKLGIRSLLVTNASGGIRDDLAPGSIMLITDHLSYFCPSPLLGPNLEEFGTRFPDMTEIYKKDLLTMAKKAASTVQVPITEGIYAFFRGPQYETPAEIRGIRLLGADAAGMSTVPETIVAHHSGMDILGISLITNKAAGLGTKELNHLEVTQTAQEAERRLVTLVKEIIKEWDIHYDTGM